MSDTPVSAIHITSDSDTVAKNFPMFISVMQKQLQQSPSTHTIVFTPAKAVFLSLPVGTVEDFSVKTMEETQHATIEFHKWGVGRVLMRNAMGKVCMQDHISGNEEQMRIFMNMMMLIPSGAEICGKIEYQVTSRATHAYIKFNFDIGPLAQFLTAKHYDEYGIPCIASKAVTKFDLFGPNTEIQTITMEEIAQRMKQAR